MSAPHRSLLTLLLAVLLLGAALTHAFVGDAAGAFSVERPIGPPAAQTTAPPRASFTGPGSCAATACHGAVRPVAGSRIAQTEYTTWIAQDRHARATEVLSNAVSVRMAKILGLGAANTAPTCLACHSLDAPEAAQARSFAQEGVSCEACHGPASAWLGPHTTKGWTHAQSVQLGMIDTKDIVKRTEMCLSCHLGTAQKFVDHEMIAAGHPDLVFDLEAFSAAMPRHWRPAPEIDGYAPVRAFSIGQLVHARAALDRLTWRLKDARWPEYAELDCFSCHHSLTRPEASWRQATGYDNRRPGDPPLNMARWTTARHVLAALDPRSAEELTPLMAAIAREGSRRRVDAGPLTGTIGRARAILDRGIAMAVAARPDGDMAGRLFRAIASDADAIAMQGERAAEQAAMAMETLYAALPKRDASPAARQAFDELFAHFQSPSSYDPRTFVARVRRIEAAVGLGR